MQRITAHSDLYIISQFPRSRPLFQQRFQKKFSTSAENIMLDRVKSIDSYDTVDMIYYNFLKRQRKKSDTSAKLI